jgi:GxxExxY protein
MITKEQVNEIAFRVVGCAIKVHNYLGPGLLESVYREAIEFELSEDGLKFKKHIAVPIKYKSKILGTPLKLDLLVEDLIIVEVKAVESILPVFNAQTLTHMKLTEKPKGLLINFNCVNITKHGLVPLVNDLFAVLQKTTLLVQLSEPKCP